MKRLYHKYRCSHLY